MIIEKGIVFIGCLLLIASLVFVIFKSFKLNKNFEKYKIFHLLVVFCLSLFLIQHKEISEIGIASISIKFVKNKAEYYLKKIKKNKEEIENISSNLKLIEDDFKKQYILQQEALEVLQNRNYITSLADQSISGGNRKAYNKLKRLFFEKEEAALVVEIYKIKEHFYNNRRLEDSDIYINKGTELEKKNEHIPYENLINHARNSDNWMLRARAVEFLKKNKFKKHKKEIMELMVDRCVNDDNLFVVNNAINVFTQLSNCKTSDVLECDILEDWWKKNKDEIK